MTNTSQALQRSGRIGQKTKQGNFRTRQKDGRHVMGPSQQHNYRIKFEESRQLPNHKLFAVCANFRNIGL